MLSVSPRTTSGWRRTPSGGRKGLRLPSVPYESCSAAGNVFALRQFCVCHWEAQNGTEPPPMHGLIYLIGLIVVILFILSLFGLR